MKGKRGQTRESNLAQKYRAPGQGTTVMIRNIPNEYTQDELIMEVSQSMGSADIFDFFYLPWDSQNNCNVGYAFVNFHNNSIAQLAVRVFSSYKFRLHVSSKVGQVSPAHIQGLENNLRHLQDRAVVHGNLPCSPVVMLKGKKIELSVVFQELKMQDTLNKFREQIVPEPSPASTGSARLPQARPSSLRAHHGGGSTGMVQAPFSDQGHDRRAVYADQGQDRCVGQAPAGALSADPRRELQHSAVFDRRSNPMALPVAAANFSNPGGLSSPADFVGGPGSFGGSPYGLAGPGDFLSGPGGFGGSCGSGAPGALGAGPGLGGAPGGIGAGPGALGVVPGSHGCGPGSLGGNPGFGGGPGSLGGCPGGLVSQAMPVSPVAAPFSSPGGFSSPALGLHSDPFACAGMPSGTLPAAGLPTGPAASAPGYTGGMLHSPPAAASYTGGMLGLPTGPSHIAAFAGGMGGALSGANSPCSSNDVTTASMRADGGGLDDLFEEDDPGPPPSIPTSEFVRGPVSAPAGASGAATLHSRFGISKPLRPMSSMGMRRDRHVENLPVVVDSGESETSSHHSAGLSAVVAVPSLSAPPSMVSGGLWSRSSTMEDFLSDEVQGGQMSFASEGQAADLSVSSLQPPPALPVPPPLVEPAFMATQPAGGGELPSPVAVQAPAATAPAFAAVEIIGPAPGLPAPGLTLPSSPKQGIKDISVTSAHDDILAKFLKRFGD